MRGDYRRYVWTSALYVGKVSTQDGISAKKIPEEDLPTADREDLQAELDKIKEMGIFDARR